MNRQKRMAQCALTTGGYTVTGNDRKCWHLQRINELLNVIRQRIREVNALTPKVQELERKVANQRRTLAFMNVAAEAKNVEIARLQAVASSNTTPTLLFTEGTNNDET